jgi:hypothetical protein
LTEKSTGFADGAAGASFLGRPGDFLAVVLAIVLNIKLNSN